MKSIKVTSGNQKIFDLGMESMADLQNLESVCFDYHRTEEQFRLGLEHKAFHVLGYFENTILAGYLAYFMVLDEVDILNLGVHPDFRRNGVGRNLMLFLLCRCRKMNIKRGVLDVKVTNSPARNLYESLGFKKVGVRKKYYPDTKEDAILYNLEF